VGNWPKRWKDLPLAVIDVETTGLDAATDRIIEIAIIRFEHGEVVERYTQLVDPECELPQETTRITGISASDLEGAPPFSDIAGEVHRRIQDVGVVAYNLSFDRKFVTQALERVGLGWPDDAPCLDPLVFARQFFKNAPRKNLSAISNLLGIPLEEAHRAAHDAEVAGRVLFAFEERLPEELDDLLVVQSQWETQHAREMKKTWKKFDGGLGVQFGERPIELGPAYVYGDEADPLRALYMSVPEAPNRDR
jgi:DNA polymerase III subunit epsilon